MVEIQSSDRRSAAGPSQSKASPKLRVLIVDDHRIVREGLKRIVQDEGDIQVAGEAAESLAALALLRSHPFDVALLDINLPGRSGMDLLKIVKAELPALPVLILSASPEEQYGVRALRDGASGYLSKDCVSESLVTAIRKVARGGKYISPTLAEHLARQFIAVESAAQESLTDREIGVLQLIASAKSTKQIADSLHLSPDTAIQVDPADPE